MNNPLTPTANNRHWLDTLLAMGLPWPLRLGWYLCLATAFGLLLALLAAHCQQPSVSRAPALSEPPAMVQAPSVHQPAQASVPADAPAVLPVKPPAAPVIGVGQALKVQGFGELSPMGQELNWQAAAEHCSAQGLRLPSVAALQALWQQRTQGRPSNAELCTQAGWPLGKLCGGGRVLESRSSGWLPTGGQPVQRPGPCAACRGTLATGL